MKGIALKVEVLPLKNDVVQFCSDIWGNRGNFNHNAEWLSLLEISYCPNVIEKEFILLGLILSRRPFKSYNWKSCWGQILVQKAFLFIPFMENLSARSLNKIETILDWLAQAKTTLLPKNEQTQGGIWR